jgi:hypothetical protein
MAMEESADRSSSDGSREWTAEAALAASSISRRESVCVRTASSRIGDSDCCDAEFKDDEELYMLFGRDCSLQGLSKASRTKLIEVNFYPVVRFR